MNEENDILEEDLLDEPIDNEEELEEEILEEELDDDDSLEDSSLPDVSDEEDLTGDDGLDDTVSESDDAEEADIDDTSDDDDDDEYDDSEDDDEEDSEDESDDETPSSSNQRTQRTVLGSDKSDSSVDDPIRLYLREIGRESLLNAEQEVELSKRMEEGAEIIKEVIHASGVMITSFADISEVSFCTV